jgi:hypothetical protein
VAATGLRVALLAHPARSGDFVEKLLAAAPAVSTDTAAEDTYTPRHRGVWQGVLTFYRHGFSVILIRGARSLCTISRFRSNPMPVALPRKRVEDSSSTALQDSVSRAELGKADRHAAPFGG